MTALTWFLLLVIVLMWVAIFKLSKLSDEDQEQEKQ